MIDFARRHENRIILIGLGVLILSTYWVSYAGRREGRNSDVADCHERQKTLATAADAMAASATANTIVSTDDALSFKTRAARRKEAKAQKVLVRRYRTRLLQSCEDQYPATSLLPI
jgi:hypothetical protein